MKLVGYAYLIERLNLHVLPVSLFELDNDITLKDTVVAHLEFALQYDKAFMKLEGLFDLPKKDISALIRMIYNNGGKLSKHRRKQYIHLPKQVLDQVEVVVNKAFS